MACRDVYQSRLLRQKAEEASFEAIQKAKDVPVKRLLFGVDSIAPANEILQNNLTLFEWVTRNKIYPNFWGRIIGGENGLSKEEIKFLHEQGCKIVPTFISTEIKETEEQGKKLAEEISALATELEIPMGKAIFLTIQENDLIKTNFMKGFAETMLEHGYTPGYKVNTDAKFHFDREYSRGMQIAKDIFEKSIIWALAPSLPEYERVTTTHLIHPDFWKPFAPSAIMRNEIVIWQYGKNCHPIYSDNDNEITFNINLVRNKYMIINKML